MRIDAYGEAEKSWCGDTGSIYLGYLEGVVVPVFSFKLSGVTISKRGVWIYQIRLYNSVSTRTFMLYIHVLSACHAVIKL